MFQTNVEESDLEKYGLTDDCAIFSGLPSYISFITGATITAARLLVNRQFKTVINWDGGRHHAQKSRASGFCYINDIVLAIDMLRECFGNVLYIDIDVHHGDGVEYAFSSSKSVTTISFHLKESGFFPGSGNIDDIGVGRGIYRTINIPLLRGLSCESFRQVFELVTTNAIINTKADVIVMQCGTDSLAMDPLGGWNLDSNSISNAVSHILSFNIPTLLLGGGGYQAAKAARTWTQCTAAAVQQELCLDIPDHDFYTIYAPEYSLDTGTNRMKDENLTDGYLESIMKKIGANLKYI